jgi:uncharacterized protein (TIGR02300 family)
MAKPEWGIRRKCIDCGSAFYDFKKEPPVCPKCGSTQEKKEVIEILENQDDDIPQNEDEIIVDNLESMEEDDYSEMDVESDLHNVDPNLVNDDDIDNVFVEDSVDLEEIEDDLKGSIGIDQEGGEI